MAVRVGLVRRRRSVAHVRGLRVPILQLHRCAIGNATPGAARRALAQHDLAVLRKRRINLSRPKRPRPADRVPAPLTTRRTPWDCARRVASSGRRPTSHELRSLAERARGHGLRCAVPPTPRTADLALLVVVATDSGDRGPVAAHADIRKYREAGRTRYRKRRSGRRGRVAGKSARREWTVESAQRSGIGKRSRSVTTATTARLASRGLVKRSGPLAKLSVNRETCWALGLEPACQPSAAASPLGTGWLKVEAVSFSFAFPLGGRARDHPSLPRAQGATALIHHPSSRARHSAPTPSPLDQNGS